MKIGVLIMSTPVEPSCRNIDGMLASFIHDAQDLAAKGELRHTYDFVVYEGVVKDETSVFPTGIPELIKEEDLAQNVHRRVYDIQESVYTTYEKTFAAFKDVVDTYDIIVRINISTFVNIRLLDRLAEEFDPSRVYCNAINSYIDCASPYVNDMYPRGDFYIMSNATLRGILDHGSDLIDCDKFVRNRVDVPHVDDCLVGLAMLRYFNEAFSDTAYIEHYDMLQYNFMPMPALADRERVNIHGLASRVKTIPPHERYSGYSWDDNEYRKMDSVKMCVLSKAFSHIDNSVWDGVHLSDILTDKGKGRTAVYVNTSSCNPDSMDYIEIARHKYGRG